MSLAPGTRIGAFEILGPLGAGGMGEVYRARDTRLGRDVAIKALPPAFAEDRDRLLRFEREAQTLASLNHPNIAAIYGLEDAGVVPHLVLELVEGESLAARLAQGPMSPRQALEICVQIAAAIEAAHERGIVHRDLKPSNVMITSTGVAKVLDFGLAKIDPPLDPATDSAGSRTLAVDLGATLEGVVLGTAAYMSPEQARGRSVDRRSDVWSFGCVLYECLVGKPAFSGETVSDLIARILEREPDFGSLPVASPPRVRDIVRRCLRKDAAERPRDIRDVRIELAEASAAGGRTESPPDQSIAVLPFINLSGSDDEYFADGVTDEILNALAQVEGLRVAARTSCFAFKGRQEEPRAVGEKLGVATVLEGTVRRAGTRLRITAQLVHAAGGYQLWSERYEREMTDVFEVQDEIANTIASRLRLSMSGEAAGAKARRGTTSVPAYELLLKGRALQNRRGADVFEAIGCFERAIALDPGYAEALAWLADSFRLLGTYGALPAADVMPKAKAAAERALAIDPNLAEALATLADVLLQYDRDFARARTMWSAALTSDPRHVRARCERALWLLCAGDFTATEALEEIARAAVDDPLNTWVAGMHSFAFGFAGRHGEGIEQAERALRLDGAGFFAQWGLMRAQAWAGNYDLALERLPALLSTSGRHVWVLGTQSWIYGKTARPEKARAVFDEMEARSRLEFVAPFWLASAASSAGLDERALEYAAQSVRKRDPLVVMVRIFPQWDGVRALPGFEEVVRGVWGSEERP